MRFNVGALRRLSSYVFGSGVGRHRHHGPHECRWGQRFQLLSEALCAKALKENSGLLQLGVASEQLNQCRGLWPSLTAPIYIWSYILYRVYMTIYIYDHRFCIGYV